MVPSLTSSIIATVYALLVTVLAGVQFYRSKTPLRLGSAIMALLGLSIASLAILYSTDPLRISVFWVYQFLAECAGVTFVVLTIIHLGYAFYPLTRHQTLLWRTALGSVLLYDLVAMAELVYYCIRVWGPHGDIITTAANTGALVTDTLALDTPIPWLYWVRQVTKVLACAVTISYLFVPLVRHHNSTGVAMIADGNTLAVGIWYLSALGLTFVGYASILIYYMTKPDKVFTIQAQTLDLCVRITACPIFSLPPPAFLLRFFQSRYGSTAGNENPNTMIEEGITNNPRPRRPPMLVSHPTSYTSRRQSAYLYGESEFEENHTLGSPSPLAPNLDEEDEEQGRCHPLTDKETRLGGAAATPNVLS